MTKVIQVTLTSGVEVNVRELTLTELGPFLRCLPALKKISELTGAGSNGGGVILPPPDLTDAELAPLYELLARVTGMPLEQITSLPLPDGFGLINVMGELIPQNFTQAANRRRRSASTSHGTPPA